MLDINAMRNKKVVAPEEEAVMISQTFDGFQKACENQFFSLKKYKSFDEALSEFIVGCSSWYGASYNDLQNYIVVLLKDKGCIMAHVLYASILDLLLKELQHTGHYDFKDKTVFNERGIPVCFFKELYINYCLCQYINVENTEVKEYYKMRAEQGFGCTLEEEVIRRITGEPCERMNLDFSEEMAVEQLYEYTKSWGVGPSSQYSFVTYWKESTDIPEYIVDDLIIFMKELRDYMDITNSCTVCSADFMHVAYNLALYYAVLGKSMIFSMHNLLMMVLRFRCVLDEHRKVEACYQQNQMRGEI